MSDGQDLNAIGQIQEDHMILEPGNPDLSDLGVINSRYGGTSVGASLYSAERRVDYREKILAEAGPAGVEPCGRFGQFGLRFRADHQRLAQRFASPRSMRSRTSRHGVPGSSPDRARAARRAISAAQAASASSSDSGSRLSINSAASSARSSSSSFSASFSSCRASLVTLSIVTPGRPANKRLERTGARPARHGRAAVGAGG